MIQNFYVYEHWRPDTATCFYVGKGGGKGKRAWNTDRSNNKHYSNIVAKLARGGLRVDIRIVTDGLTEAEAFILEKIRIAFWREVGNKLANRTDGGEGPSGFKPTAEHIEKIRATSKANWADTEYKRRLSDKLKATWAANRESWSASIRRAWDNLELRAQHSAMSSERMKDPDILAAAVAALRSPEALDKLTKIRKTPEFKEKLRLAHLGKVHSLETREKMSSSAKGHTVSEETRLKLAAQKGWKHSDEAKAKMRAAWAVKRAALEWAGNQG